MKLIHAAVKTKDLDQSLTFYTNILNLKIKEKRYIEVHKVTLVFLKDDESNFELELIYEEKESLDFISTNENGKECSFAHFAFMTDNIDKDFITMKEKGAVFTRDPFYSLDKTMKLAFLEDPNNITIELIQYL
ncbi:MAG: VOC family protein [Deltaproteobacteria bacterium]|nr:VOC family protein [Deltaproteobacteria bacterium]